MRSGFFRHLPVAVVGVALIGAALALPGDIAAADPNQDQKFFDLLGAQDIPPVDGENGLVTTAHRICAKLDEGMAVGDMVELIRNNGFQDNPLARLQNQAQITRTIDRFINAAVEAYCPYDRGKIASIAAYEPRPDAAGRITLVSFVLPVPAGEINPTKPLPVPAQTPPPVPQEVPPPPQEPPPPPRHAPPVPKQAPRPAPPQEPPPPAEAPEAPPPEAAPPAPAAPGGGGNAPVPGAPGGGTGGGSTPSPQTPDQPAPPGHIRLAP